jgi:hypothetical protein
MEAMNVAGLSDQMPQGLLPGEQTIASWRVLPNPGAPYIYLQIDAFDMNAHPDIPDLAKLASVKTLLVCRDSNTCQVNATQDATFGGTPAKIVDATEVRQFLDGVSLTGISSDASPGDTSTQLTWSSRDVLLIRGNWGYDIRLVSIDPNLFSSRLADLDQVLASLQFHY